jgi:hypothetical protein
MPPVDREQGIFWKVNISLMPLMVMNRTILRIARSLIHPLTVDLAPEGDPSFISGTCQPKNPISAQRSRTDPKALFFLLLDIPTLLRDRRNDVEVLLVRRSNPKEK